VTRDTTQLVAKVDVRRVSDPAAYVRDLLTAAHVEPLAVEEVFPGLATGHSAGLVTVTLGRTAGAAAAIKVLEGDISIVHAGKPAVRRPKR
jgi:hypothetical protein